MGTFARGASAAPQYPDSTRTLRRVRIVTGTVLLGVLGVVIADLAYSGAPPGEVAVAIWLGIASGIAALVLWRRGPNRVAWLMLGATALGAVWLLAMTIAARGVEAGHTGGFVAFVAWLAQWVGIPPAGAFIYVFLLFPGGRLPGPRWTWVAAAGVVGVGLVTLAHAFVPGPLEARPEIENPVGILGASALAEAIEDAGTALVIVAALAALASLVIRWRRSEGDERHQLKWLLYGASLLAIGVLFAMLAEGALNEASFVGLLVGLFAVPATLGVALLKYRLYDIDIVVNRTIVYVFLTASVVVIYIVLVGTMGALFQSRIGLVPALIATAIVAVSFQSLRNMLQRIVDRAMFGDRLDPYAALSRLGERLDATLLPGQVLPVIVETLTTSLKLGYAAIEVERDGRYEVVASKGERDEVTRSLPLNYQGRSVGRLVVSERRDAPLSGSDRRLLEDLARQAGAAAHTVALTDAVRRSRDELVSAREEERRRLRRDLHDGLGPELAGITLGLAAVRNLKERDPEAADELLAQLQDQTVSAARSVRAIVEGLRDGALDDLGLSQALRQKVEGLGRNAGIDIAFFGPSDLPPIPAAVEVAALRIVLEAVTNVVRHANATRCTVRLEVDGELSVEVVDDGSGIDRSARRGVGLDSMADRAAEVGGTFDVDSTDSGGTRVRARLPLQR